MTRPLRIIFIGTADFGAPSLKALVEAGYNVVAVITALDKPQGRGLKTRESPIKSLAKSLKLPILQPKNLKSAAFGAQLKTFKANLQIVIAFRMLPECVWALPELGTFNLHASLLPHYRGAAPIHWAIINGETKTGLTTFFLKHAIDTGDIIFQAEEPIYSADTAGTLYDRLKSKGQKLVLKTVRAIETNTLNLKPQSASGLQNSAPKLFKSNTELNFKQTSLEMYNFIRGLAPYPLAWTIINNHFYKISAARMTPITLNFEGCSYLQVGFKLYFKTSDGALEILKLQKAGKKAMPVAEFLKGNTL